MKFSLLIILTVIYFNSFSQYSPRVTKQKIFKISVTHVAPGTSFGYIADVDDSIISLVRNAASIKFSAYKEKDLEKINYNDIQKIVIRRKGSTGRGILYGALIGLGTGAIMGFAMGDDAVATTGSPDWYGLDIAVHNAFRMTAGEKAIVGGVAGSIGGAIVGGILGAVAKKKFIIGGKKEKFNKMQFNVLDKLYGKRPGMEE